LGNPVESVTFEKDGVNIYNNTFDYGDQLEQAYKKGGAGTYRKKGGIWQKD
jgi:hypothetical protein